MIIVLLDATLHYLLDVKNIEVSLKVSRCNVAIKLTVILICSEFNLVAVPPTIGDVVQLG